MTVEKVVNIDNSAMTRYHFAGFKVSDVCLQEEAAGPCTTKTLLDQPTADFANGGRRRVDAVSLAIFKARKPVGVATASYTYICVNHFRTEYQNERQNAILITLKVLPRSACVQ